MTEKYTLKEAIDFLKSLNNSPNTISMYTRNLINFVANVNAEPNYRMMTTNELFEKYQESDLVPILKDFDHTSNVIENEILNKDSGQPLANDTKKQYYNAIRILMVDAPGHLELEKETKQFYQEKVKYFDELSNQKRRQNIPTRANAKHPDLTYPVMQKMYNDFITTHAFTNTEKGRKDLKTAVVAGFYILQRPRRVEDWHKLMWYSKLPSEEERKGKNIVHIEKDTATIYIDKFKTRTRTKNNKTKELLGTYIKELNPKLASLLRDYVKKAGIRDMAKITRDEKRDGTEFYIYHLVDKPDQTYKTAGGLGDIVETAFHQVFGRKKVTANTIRHAFNQWIADHINEYTDEQLREIAIDVGDTPKDLPTNLRYRMARQENVGMTKTEIQGMLEDDYYAQQLAQAGAEEEGSVAGDVGEARSVSRMEFLPRIHDEEQEESELVEVSKGFENYDSMSIADMYRRLGEIDAAKVRMEAERNMILKKLVG